MTRCVLFPCPVTYTDELNYPQHCMHSYRAVHTMKIMRIKFESIRIMSIHTEAALTAMRIQFAFSQSTSIGGLKPVCNHNPLIT